RYDALLVMGWQTMAHVQLIGAARTSGLPLLIRGESNLLRRPAGGVRAAVRRFVWTPLRSALYRRMFARVDAFITIGRRNADYYRSFGVPDAKLFFAGYGVDNSHFALGAEQAAAARIRLRGEHGIGMESVVFVSSAKIIPRKRPLDLLTAFATLGGGGRDAHLVYLGDGAQRGEVEREARRLGVRDRVTVTGFVNQRSIPDWYAASDCLVLPSDTLETWGLVVNEAMAAGLPVIVSDAAGCAPDLVIASENGYTYPCGDVSALASRMIDILERGAPARRSMGERSRQIVAAFSPEHAAAVIADAVVELVKH
ncbi:MAG TPA: glycosyltransferase family 4 protein, partial [Gemmatimonadaceae bacterium]|nr:glycosyltransferase family 4 protein [Gemmatimonadaceae bacterium]